MTPKPMLTLSQVMEKLRERGITDEIRMNDNKKFVISGTEKSYNAEDLKIIRVYRFEGASDPDDNAALYLVEDTYGNKAMIIDSYGASSNYDGPEFDEFLKAIPTEEKEEFDF
ncbi:hypothetical protein SAMN05660493_00022 [Epilithonimonas bovis DSM 19482]|uniref:Phosphoribosylpyrophosphate synthetase n=1 Tax=Epilithonimonas bovis DSM 19482 TaxID=1121284 RepID=A0A1U7PRQ0_9FLAO|nr:hypothetical protein [Epilithonimonas bovis]SIT95377.1 hypothetical protein SAMN05660493_00022 [Epilithonimonas bovis DSM 19482]HBR11485.1 hypothetical protein [Chryseobacterium sp.]